MNLDSIKGPTYPWWWQIYCFVTKPYEYLPFCLEKYGDPFIAQIIAGREFVIFSNPVANKDILTGNYNDFYAGSINVPLLPVLGSDSLLLIDGENHIKKRRLITPSFHGQYIKEYGETIRKVVVEQTSSWQSGTTIHIQQAMQKISLEVILRVVFGLNEGPRFQEYKKTLVSYLSAFNGINAALLYVKSLQRRLGPFTGWNKYLKIKQQVDKLVYDEIEERQRTQNPLDVISKLISSEDDEGNSLAKKELRDQLLTLLLAGHETTATALTWCFYWLHYVPDTLLKLQEELETLNNNFDIEQVIHLPYLDAVCREALRLYPVVPGVGRVLQRPASIMGYDLPAGTPAVISIYLTHQNPEIYPEPKKFRPQRFLERKFSPYEYLPFGGGVRKCLGATFALYEMKIVLASILLQFSMQLQSSRPVQIKRRGVTLAPVGGVPMRIN